MKKRLLKKKISSMSDRDLYEAVAYESGFKLFLVEKEFDKRFSDAMNFDEQLANELIYVSDEALKIEFENGSVIESVVPKGNVIRGDINRYRIFE